MVGGFPFDISHKTPAPCTTTLEKRKPIAGLQTSNTDQNTENAQLHFQCFQYTEILPSFCPFQHMPHHRPCKMLPSSLWWNLTQEKVFESIELDLAHLQTDLARQHSTYTGSFNAGR